VSFVRVFSWLSISLLLTLGGILLFLLASGPINEKSEELY
jgi:hypothetical protein